MIQFSAAYSRCLEMDVFGYLLSFESISPTTYVNRYDRTSLTLIKRTPLPITYTTVGALTYYNKMIFIGTENSSIYIFDHVNFTLLGNISCGTSLSEPRNLIFMESLNIMIVASYTNNKIVFFRINSATSYTCLNSTSLNGGPQALQKINDTFFYATAYQIACIYSYQFDGQVWIQSLFANITQTLGIANTDVAQVRVDQLQRRWVMLPKYGLIIYDQFGTYLSKWKMGYRPFDIFISNDYRVIIAENSNFSVTLYDSQVRVPLM
jgi:hypothetical protein